MTEAKKKDCPMFTIGNGTGYVRCRGKKCAWWDSRSEKCSVLVIADRTDAISREV